MYYEEMSREGTMENTRYGKYGKYGKYRKYGCRAPENNN